MVSPTRTTGGCAASLARAGPLYGQVTPVAEVIQAADPEESVTGPALGAFGADAGDSAFCSMSSLVNNVEFRETPPATAAANFFSCDILRQNATANSRRTRRGRTILAL
jgi:hypothetical protein